MIGLIQTRTRKNSYLAATEFNSRMVTAVSGKIASMDLTK